MWGAHFAAIGICGEYIAPLLIHEKSRWNNGYVVVWYLKCASANAIQQLYMSYSVMLSFPPSFLRLRVCIFIILGGSAIWFSSAPSQWQRKAHRVSNLSFIESQICNAFLDDCERNCDGKICCDVLASGRTSWCFLSRWNQRAECLALVWLAFSVWFDALYYLAIEMWVARFLIARLF